MDTNNEDGCNSEQSAINTEPEGDKGDDKNGPETENSRESTKEVKQDGETTKETTVPDEDDLTIHQNSERHLDNNIGVIEGCSDILIKIEPAEDIDNYGQGQGESEDISLLADSAVVLENMDESADVSQVETVADLHIDLVEDEVSDTERQARNAEESEDDNIGSVSDVEQESDKDESSHDGSFLQGAKENKQDKNRKETSLTETDELLQGFHDDGNSSIISDIVNDTTSRLCKLWGNYDLKLPPASKRFDAQRSYYTLPKSLKQKRWLPEDLPPYTCHVTSTPIGYYLENGEAQVSILAIRKYCLIC